MVQFLLTMPAERVPIDVSGLKERIENAFSDAAWKELSFAKRARLILIEGLESIEKKNNLVNGDSLTPKPARTTTTK